MPRPKTLPPPAEYHPSPVEVATLAARFLPCIELPDGWEASDPDTLRRNLGRPTGTPFPHNPAYRPDEGWRLPWEVVCEEAVKRARILLDAAAGKVREKVKEWDAATDEATTEAEANDAEAEELRKRFDKLAGKRLSLPILEVLKFCQPRVTTDGLRMRYFNNYLEGWRTDYNDRHPTAQQPPIADQASRTVRREEFPQFVRSFKAALAIHGEAWRKELAREVGIEGQAIGVATRRAREDEEGAVPAFAKGDAKKLDAAAKKHKPATRGT
jgi:hypothetical protein